MARKSPREVSLPIDPLADVGELGETDIRFINIVRYLIAQGADPRLLVSGMMTGLEMSRIIADRDSRAAAAPAKKPAPQRKPKG